MLLDWYGPGLPCVPKSRSFCAGMPMTESGPRAAPKQKMATRKATIKATKAKSFQTPRLPARRCNSAARAMVPWCNFDAACCICPYAPVQDALRPAAAMPASAASGLAAAAVAGSTAGPATAADLGLAAEVAAGPARAFAGLADGSAEASAEAAAGAAAGEPARPADESGARAASAASAGATASAAAGLGPAGCSLAASRNPASPTLSASPRWKGARRFEVVLWMRLEH
mmetsp:Transcript_12785/g.40103  ORF Transcript_12785/g.40103 Transcript_12785/m.40103 type:complete len:229 (-) Transcript_12785:210-896(-)